MGFSASRIMSWERARLGRGPWGRGDRGKHKPTNTHTHTPQRTQDQALRHWANKQQHQSSKAKRSRAKQSESPVIATTRQVQHYSKAKASKHTVACSVLGSKSQQPTVYLVGIKHAFLKQSQLLFVRQETTDTRIYTQPQHPQKKQSLYNHPKKGYPLKNDTRTRSTDAAPGRWLSPAFGSRDRKAPAPATKPQLGIL